MEGFFLKEKLINKFFLIKAVYRVITMFILISIVFYIGRIFFPEWNEIIFTEYFWFIYSLIALYLGYIRYRELKDISEHLQFIFDNKKEELSSTIMEQCVICSETYVEINKTKLDILKSLSPVPLVIFIFGIYMNDNSIINNEIHILSSKLFVGDILMFIGISIPIFYIYYLFSAFRSYSKSARIMADYKSESVILNKKQ